MTDTKYREISPIQEPFDAGVDDQGRAVVVFNVTIIKDKSDTLARELVTLLAGVGIFGTNLFVSNRAKIPPTGTIVVITETGGASPERIHNQISPKYTRPTAKIAVHADKYEVAMAKSQLAYAALSVVRNQSVTVA